MPTIALGIFGWRLLRQEEIRLTESAAAAQVARAELVAENLTLFLEEARSGIIAGLSEMPPGDAHESLRTWSDANPLVRHTFVWQPRAGIIPPPPDATPETYSAFLQRHRQLLAPRSYWESEPESLTRSSSAPTKQAANDVSAGRMDVTPRQELKQIADEARLANIAQQREMFASSRPSPMAARAAEPEAEFYRDSAAKPSRDLRLERSSAEPAAVLPRIVASGWIPLLDEDPLAAIAWVELQPGGEVRGAEVDLASIVSRMLAVLPSEEKSGELYQLINHAGESHPQISASLSPAAIRLDLGPLLPGWQLAAETFEGDTAAGRGFFVVSSLLLGVLLTAILAGGSLLLYQAHRDQLDARQKSSFVSNVSHELKTPLTTIRMYAELIGEGRIADETKQRNYLNVIVTESHRLTRLINNVLDFSRLEQTRKQVQAQPIFLRSALEPILETQEMRLQQAGMKLIRDFPDEGLSVLMDPDALEQAALNLIDNAIKYASSGGELTIRIESTDSHVYIHFLDKGPGIATRHQRRLFRQFSRGDTSLTADQPGCGLGLNIARRLLRRAGGDLTYTSRPAGGAQFTIALRPESPNLKSAI